MNKTTMLLVRHGQTDWNLENKFQGHTDIPLNETGIEQAKKAACFLKKQKQVSISALYSSDLQRAHQTAQEIAQLFSLDIALASDLREGHLGKLEGLTKSVANELYGSFNYKSLPEELEAEPRDKVVLRVMNYLNAVVEKHSGQSVCVVTHGGVIRSLLAFLGHNIEELPQVENCSVIILTLCTDLKTFVLESIEHP